MQLSQILAVNPATSSFIASWELKAGAVVEGGENLSAENDGNGIRGTGIFPKSVIAKLAKLLLVFNCGNQDRPPL